MTRSQPRLITIFTPSDAAESNTNAQNLTVKEIVARLPEDQFHVTMLCEGDPDPRLARRRNTRLVRWTQHGNTLRLLRHCLLPPPDIYFFPRSGPLDRVFFDVRKRMGLKTALVTYIVMAMNQAPGRDSIAKDTTAKDTIAQDTTGQGMIRRSVLEADIVIGNSKHVAETVFQALKVKAGVIYDGVDRRHYFPRERAGNPTPVVLYAGSFQPRKRVELVVQQAARLPAFQFRLAGKGETEQQCRDLAQRLGCRNLSFLGHLSSEMLGEEMRRADIFFFPSLLEGNPQVLLQAAACGLPCLAMELYRSDYVLSGRTGFLAGSDVELSESLERLAGDAALRASFTVAAVCHANRFDWETIAGQWSTVFQEVVARRRSYSQPRYQPRAS